ncbi:Uu.00g014640.m01.CDS01 [Anthostomella pinea]|uniref:Uu.00g014640.m01.CDS01 n=1 Tax=Anthostomella pinea TaxID=933095 RepID=A0AAI8VYY6_9PEZI|nr:Uu.00g014640.m01.CDS01 [Anthostomella pinea]
MPGASLVLNSLDLLSVSSPGSRALSLNSKPDSYDANGPSLPTQLNFYLSSSTLPLGADPVLFDNLAASQPSDLGLVWASSTMPHLDTSDGNYIGFKLPAGRPNAVALSTTADYHTFLDQQRQHQSGRESGPQHEAPPSPRKWLSLPHTRRTVKTGTRGNGDSASAARCRRKKEDRRARSRAVRELASSPQLQPQPLPTRQDVEEFEALPLAVRRKYFSTLERLRFAQTSGTLDQTSRDKPCRGPRDRGAHHPERTAVRRPATTSPTSPTSPTHRDHAASVEPLSLAKLPAKIREKHLTREEQLAVAKQLRESVILDAADEAIYKIGRRASRHLSPQVYTPTLSSSARPSMDSLPSDKQLPVPDQPHDAFYDSFRWLDQDDDLDLRLTLDDYHADYQEPKALPTSEPLYSLRRRLSISKRPFGRSSLSSSRPATKDSPTPPQVAYPQHVRRKSRALSLVTPKHGPQASLASIDPEAAHYQDPEARLKLRVYLASPQKFDEAIEFGFPSNDVRFAGLNRDAAGTGKSYHRMMSPDPENFKTFLADDKSSIYSDDISIPDESPRTPHTPDRHVQTMTPLQRRPSEHDGSPHQYSEGYAQAPAASREMTLRMTLTRPDLRAREDQMYGRQGKAPQQAAGRVSQSSAPRAATPAPTTQTRDANKESMDRIFADIDQELGPQADGVVKRFWNRVRRN